MKYTGLKQNNENMENLIHWDYCKFLLASQVNYTQTYFVDHSEEFSHDQIIRMMRESQFTPRELLDMVGRELALSENGFILFDDPDVDKSHSFAKESQDSRSNEGVHQIPWKGLTCRYKVDFLNNFI